LHGERIAIQFQVTFQTGNASKEDAHDELGKSENFQPMHGSRGMSGLRRRQRSNPARDALIIPSAARATPVFAEQTGQPCSRCHTSPTGGKDLTDFGKEFKVNGNQIKN
jgi:hypothetical protein